MIYTRQGDAGKSSLGREELSKSDVRFELLGNIDELSSFIGLAKAKLKDEDSADYISLLETVQANLSLIAAGVYDSANPAFDPTKDSIAELEAQIDRMQSVCPTVGFVRPGGCELSACLDICRSVARRTERSFCSVAGETGYRQFSVKPEILAYLNRLSDFLFAFARYADFLSEIESSVIKKLKDLREISNGSEYIGMLNLQICRYVSDKIFERAKDMKLGVSVAFCDASGNPVSACSAQGALFVSFDYALRKAYTAAALKMTTAQAQMLTQPGQMFYGLKDDRFLLIPGGTPLESEGTVIGGLGVSGGTGPQDTELSEYGAGLVTRIRSSDD